MLSFHGDLDPIVPYGYGFPFTALLTMPRVYGSSLISLRQNNIGLPNKLNTFVGEGHNVWGTVIANEFTTSESQHWSPILDSIQDFLWEYLKPVSYTIIGALSVYEQDVRNYYVPQIPGGRYCWTVDGGTIVSANPSAASIDVRWDMAGVRSIKVRPVTHLDAVGEETTQLIQVLPATSATASTPTRDLRFATGDGWIAMHSTTLTAQPFSWEITNLQGMVLAAQNQTFPSSSLKISTRDFATGMYLLKIKSKQGLDVHRFWVE